MSDTVPESTDPILQLLAERIGLDPASIGVNLIRSGVRSRMKQLGLTRQADYERVLLGPTDEAQALIEEVVIPESWFFRDERPFAALRDLARAGWLEQPSRAPLQVLCLPCAGGEEPYSVVMTLLDVGLPRERFEVVAVDVSQRSLVRATRGLYGINSFRGVPDAIRDRYFDPTDTPGRYLLRAAIRSAVQFERGNLLDPLLLAQHPSFAVVFCRNLLIYFDDQARATAARQLDRLIAADGYLFLGHADRADAGLSERFEACGRPGDFLYRRRSREAVAVPPPPVSRPPTATPSRPPAPGLPTSSPPAPRPARLTPSSSGRDGVVAGPAGSTATLPSATPSTGSDAPADEEPLVRAAVLAGRGQYAEAVSLVRQRLRRGPHDAPAHLLLGMIYQAAGDRVQAEAELLKAVYLDPEQDEALLALALLARRRGDVAAEAVLRRRAERVRARRERL